MNLDKNLKELKDQFSKLNEEGIKIQKEIQMLKEAFDSNNIKRIEINANIKFVEGLLEDKGGK